MYPRCRSGHQCCTPDLRDINGPALEVDSVERLFWYHTSRYEVQAYVNAWRAWLGTLVGRDWMAGIVDLLAMIVSKRRSSSWHLIRMPFLGCVLVVASCSAHIASATAPALFVRSASIRAGGWGSDLRRQRCCQQCGCPQCQIRHRGLRPTKALI